MAKAGARAAARASRAATASEKARAATRAFWAGGCVRTTPRLLARCCRARAPPVKVFLGMEVVGVDVRSHFSAWIRAPPTISEETASRLHLVERGKKNVRVSRASCAEWSEARESVFMVCGRRPRRVLKLRSRKTDAVRKLSIHHSPLLFTSQTHVCSDTGAAHDQRRHTPGCSDGICANTQGHITRCKERTLIPALQTFDSSTSNNRDLRRGEW